LVGKLPLSSRANAKEEPVILLSVIDQETGQTKLTVAKDVVQLIALDTALKKHIKSLPRIPDKSTLAGMSPAKADKRREFIDKYLYTVFLRKVDLPQKSLDFLCRFLATNLVEIPRSPQYSIKAGYLTRRIRSGLRSSWRVYWYVLSDQDLRYYGRADATELLGTISVARAVIGRVRDNESDEEKQNRHAVLIEEQGTSNQRHVLCADTDAEREAWIDSLVTVSNGSSHDASSTRSGTARSDEIYPDVSQDPISVRSPEWDATIPRANSPIPPTRLDKRDAAIPRTNSPVPPTRLDRREANDAGSQNITSGTVLADVSSPPSTPLNVARASSPLSLSKSISGPLRGHIIEDVERWTTAKVHANGVAGTSKALFGKRGRADVAAVDSVLSHNSEYTDDTHSVHSPKPVVFGVPLADAVALSSREVNGCVVPTIVSRCIELLDSKQAVLEEGLFRLSGSNNAIKSLKERFDTEHDVDLIAADAEVHCVTGLLKRYFREIPEPIVPPVSVEERRSAESPDLSVQIACLRKIIGRLPKVNYDTLRVLCGFLVRVLNHCELNKMTIRNLGIIFPPTLHIDARIFVCLLVDYDCIFLGKEPSPGDVRPRVELPPELL
jgi:RalA-binding protein 1